MSKVLLIVHDVYQDDNEFPLGVAYIAAALQGAGVDVSVYCQDVFHTTDEHLMEKIREESYDLIGVGFLAARFVKTVLPLCKAINKVKGDAWLVLGGHGPSPIPDYVLRATQADVVVVGEGELTMVDLVNCKAENGDLVAVQGIAYRLRDDVFQNPRRAPLIDLDRLPMPAWELFPMETYTTCLVYPGQTAGERSLGMMSARGCSDRCSFCYRLEKGLRLREVDNVVEEIELLHSRYGVNYIIFEDELFVFRKKRLFEFEDALDKKGLSISFSCNARVDRLDREMAQCLKRIGCKKVNVGFEAMNQRVLDGMHKRTTVEQNVAFAELACEEGLNMGLNVMWGNPHDDVGTLRSVVDFLKKYNAYEEVRTIRPVTPYPGSPLFYSAMEKGLLKDEEDFFVRFKNSDLMTVNFTDLPDDEYYDVLFEANKELISDHFRHVASGDGEEQRLIEAFRNLYFRGDYEFSGARHYER